MNKSSKKALEQQVIISARKYGISSTLFRNAVGSRLGVNDTDMQCLGLLFFKGVATPTELSKYTGISSGATTAMLDRLEHAKLIQRKPNPKDRRGVLIQVDESSINTVGPLFADTRLAQNKLVASYTEAELQIIADFFEKFTAVWDEGREKLISN